MLLLVAALAGCGLPGDERTFTADDVTVVDGSGLVLGATTGAPQPPDAERPLDVSAGSLTRLAVHWVGSSCVDTWRVAIPRGNALRNVIEPASRPRTRARRRPSRRRSCSISTGSCRPTRSTSSRSAPR